MNWVLGLLPYWKTAKWLLAELGWQRDVYAWLEAENAWYFQLAAQLWNDLTLTSPVTVPALKAALAAKAAEQPAPVTKSRHHRGR